MWFCFVLFFAAQELAGIEDGYVEQSRQKKEQSERAGGGGDSEVGSGAGGGRGRARVRGGAVVEKGGERESSCFVSTVGRNLLIH